MTEGSGGPGPPPPPRSSPWGWEPFEQTLQRAPALWSDSEPACPRVKVLAKASAWCSASAWAPLRPQLAAGPTISSPASTAFSSLLPREEGRRGFVLPTQTGSSRAQAACVQTLKLCSWGEERPLLYGGELKAGLVTRMAGCRWAWLGLSLPTALALHRG